MDNLVGKQIEQYRIEALIGSGEIGTVYRAVDLSSNQLVAFKIIHPQLAQSVVFQQRFIREAQTITQLKHPSILPVHSFNKQEENLYIVMELMTSGSLHAFMERYQTQNQLVDMEQGLLLMAQVAEALGHAHRHGLVHGVLKPENVLIKHPSEPGMEGLRALVGDLGLSSLLDRDVFTQMNAFRSLWPYLSPEQVSGRYVDGRSDIYAMGVMLYEMTTGRLPFKIQSVTDAVLAHTRQQPPRPQQIQPKIPHKVEAIILRALEKDPEARFPTAELMGMALRDAAAALAQQPKAILNGTTDARDDTYDDEPRPRQTGTGSLAGRTGPLNRSGTQRYSTSGQLSVVVNPVNVEAIPGEVTTIRVDLFNRGDSEEQFQFRVQGLPPEWVSLSRDMVELAAGGRETLTLAIHPPNDSTARSGLHRYHILVSSESDSEEMVAITGVLTVKTFARFITSMRPRSLVNHGTCYVWIENEGNFETSYTITGRAENENIVFEHITPRLNIGPGEEAMATIEVAIKEKPYVGNPEQFPFHIKIDTASSEPQTLRGDIEIRPTWPTWVAGGIMALLAILMGLGIVAYSYFDVQETMAAQTPQPLALVVTEEATAAPTEVAVNEGVATTAVSQPTATIQPLPTEEPTAVPTKVPTLEPMAVPTEVPTLEPTAVPTEVPVITTGRWNGLWQSTCDDQNQIVCGDVILSHIGEETAVSGTFGDGTGVISATVTANVLTGTWVYGSSSGPLQLWLSDDGSSWQGSWNRTAVWCGAQPGTPLPNPCGLVSWAGEWQTSCGTGACRQLSITQNGANIEGSYASGNGTISGTASGTTISGTWTRGNNSGTFQFFLQPGGTQFSGNFDATYPWCGHDGSSDLPEPCLR